MNTQYRKNLKAVLEASKTYCDESIDNLKWELGTYDLSVDTDTDTAHIKTLPSGTIQTTVSKVEGVGYKVNQLVRNGNFVNTDYWQTNSRATFSVANNTATLTIVLLTGSDVESHRMEQYLSVISGHKYLVLMTFKSPKVCQCNISCYEAGVSMLAQNVSANTSTLYTRIITPTNTGNYGFYFSFDGYNSSNGFEVGDSVEYRNIMCFDLTADFGSGNEPSTVSDCATAYLQRGINIYEYTPQQSSIKNNAFTGVKTLGVNLWSFNRFTINAESGVSYTINNDNSITITNSSSSSARITVNGVESGSYTLSFKANGTNGYFAIFNWSPITYAYTNGTNTIQISGYSTGAWSFYVDANSSITISNVMLNEGSSAIDYIPYTSQTIPIDLTTIKDSNNVSLFPSGKMMGNSSVADFIAPYNQESRWNEYTFTGNELVDNEGNLFAVYATTIPQVKSYGETLINGLTSKNSYSDIASNDYSVGMNYRSNVGNAFFVRLTSGSTANDVKTFLTGKTIQYERATYLTSNTDLTSLTKINAQSNGTITLNNTDNVDMPNTIKTLKEVAK